MKRGRKEIITEEVLLDAKARGLSRQDLAKEMNLHNNTVIAACRRHSILLPRCRMDKSYSALDIASAIFVLKQQGRLIVGQKIATRFGVSKAYVSKIVCHLRSKGVEL